MFFILLLLKISSYSLLFLGIGCELSFFSYE